MFSRGRVMDTDQRKRIKRQAMIRPHSGCKSMDGSSVQRFVPPTSRLDLRDRLCRLCPSMGHCRVLAALAFGLIGCAKIESRDRIREGNKFYNEGRFDEAITSYDAAEALEADGVTLYWNRACAAESIVLKTRDNPQERRRYADMALRDLQTWYNRLAEKTSEDAAQYNDHRLAILDSDERCDDLLGHWLEKHRTNPKEESLYSVIARQYERCGQLQKSEEWYVKRTRDFPDSVKSWHALAIRKFDPLWPDAESGIPYNESIAPDDRIAFSNEVIAALDKATELDAKFRDAYVWRAMAYSQRMHARIVVPDAKTAEEKLPAILAREDSMLAWKQQKAVCDIDGLPECAKDSKPEGPCCPPPPLTPAEQAKDAELQRALEQELAGAKSRGHKRRKRGR